MSDVALRTSVGASTIKPKLSRDDKIMRGFIIMVGVWMVIVVLMPLYFMLSKSIEDHDGNFIGIVNLICGKEWLQCETGAHSLGTFMVEKLSGLVSVYHSFQEDFQ